MPDSNPTRYFCTIIMAMFFIVLASGCIGPDSENRSAQPWNKQRPWEHGIPGGITERR